MNKETPEQEAEIWRDVPGYEGFYQVSSIGRIKSLTRMVKAKSGDIKHLKELMIKLCNIHGYKCATLHKHGKAKTERVHRLMAAVFIPNPENKPFINHKNGIKHDNRIENLEWCTNKENIDHLFKVLGFKFSDSFKEKQRKIMTKRMDSIRKNVLCIEDNKVFRTAKEAGAYYGLHHTSIRGLIKSKGVSLKTGKTFKFCSNHE